MHVDIFFVMFWLGTVHGQDGISDCSVKNALIVPPGNNATFEAIYFFYHVMVRFSSVSKTIFYGFAYKRNIDFLTFDPGMKNRTTVIIDINRVEIIVANLSTNDNGTYNLQLDGRLQNCWFLYIMDMRLTPSGPVMENSAVRVYGNPPESLIRPLVTTTMVWLVDGLTVNQSSQFLVFDGVLWIRNVGRELHGRNVTYRAIPYSGQIEEVNITLDVTYGPSPAFPLFFTPEDTYYNLKSGDTMPDISCHAFCNPPCEVTWGSHSFDNTLRLGRVSANAAGKYTCLAKSSLPSVSRSLYLFVVEEWTVVLSPPTTAYFLSVGDSMPDINCSALCFPSCITTWNRKSTDKKLRLGAVTTEMSGEYVCTASRNDSNRQMEKSVMVFVTDDRSTRAALIAVGSIQACTTLVLGLCGLLYYLRKRGMCCSHCNHQHQESSNKFLQRKGQHSQQHADKKRKKLKEKEMTSNKPKGKDTEVERYEDIDLGRGKLQLYDKALPEQTKKKEKKKLEVYENTVVS